MSEPWEIECGITCVVCPSCAFTFSEEHESAKNYYECPNCEEGRSHAEIAALKAENERLAKENARYKNRLLRLRDCFYGKPWDDDDVTALEQAND